MDEWGAVETGPHNHAVGSGKDKSRLMVVDAIDIERYDWQVRFFSIDRNSRYVFQLADETAGEISILLLNCLLAG